MEYKDPFDTVYRL